ncbi:g7535 [Coccomyxa viridis]|uniref:G7535 protein n=1 Tax=Coccomyxa viridis TaxID=1274662 RepID=A0ABP1FY32_9CHLO
MAWDGTKIYQVTIKKPGSSQPEPAILKISLSSLIDAEVKNLERLKELGIDHGCTHVVESGPLSEDFSEKMSYLLLQPVGKPLGECESAKTIMQLGRGMAEAVGRWHKHGLLHRDLSVSNVGLAPDGTALIWDFPTMATVSEAAEDPGRLIGDPLYMGYDVQMGEPPTLSSELESIFFILLHLSSEDGVLPWQDEPSPADRDIKWSLMTVHEKVFRTKVLEYTREELRPLLQALHDLFFPDAKEFGQKIGTPAGVHNSFVGSVHTLNVSAVAFLRTLDSCEPT